MGTLLHSCAEVRATIELSLGEMSGVGHGIGVVDGGPRAPSGKGDFGGLKSANILKVALKVSHFEGASVIQRWLSI